MAEKAKKAKAAGEARGERGPGRARTAKKAAGCAGSLAGRKDAIARRDCAVGASLFVERGGKNAGTGGWLRAERELKGA